MPAVSQVLSSSGAPALSAPELRLVAPYTPEEGFELLSMGRDVRPLSVVAGLHKRRLFFDPRSGIAKLELLLSLSRARAQRTVPVADNDVTFQNRDTNVMSR